MILICRKLLHDKDRTRKGNPSGTTFPEGLHFSSRSILHFGNHSHVRISSGVRKTTLEDWQERHVALCILDRRHTRRPAILDQHTWMHETANFYIVMDGCSLQIGHSPDGTFSHSLVSLGVDF